MDIQFLLLTGSSVRRDDGLLRSFILQFIILQHFLLAF